MSEEPVDSAGEAPEMQDAPVEALMGFQDFLAVAPRFPSAAVTVAAHAGLRRWMQVAGVDVNGFYSMAQWQSYYDEAMSHTG